MERIDTPSFFTLGRFTDFLSEMTVRIPSRMTFSLISFCSIFAAIIFAAIPLSITSAAASCWQA